MNTALFREPRWLAYLRAVAFALPAIVTWGFACVMLVPKLKEIYDHTGLETARAGWLWEVTFFLVGYAKPILLWVTVTVVIAEWLGRKWLGPNRTTAMLAAWLLNAVVLFGMTSLLIMVLIAAPSLMAPK